MTARDVIAQTLALSEAATDGPWLYHAGVSVVVQPAPFDSERFDTMDTTIARVVESDIDGALIAAARTLLPALAKALGDVLDEMERPVHLDDTDEGCVPVRRLRAITDALPEVTP